MGMGGNRYRGDGKMEMGMPRWTGNGNGNDSMRVGREGEQESHSRTPLLFSRHLSHCMKYPLNPLN